MKTWWEIVRERKKRDMQTLLFGRRGTLLMALLLLLERRDDVTSPMLTLPPSRMHAKMRILPGSPGGGKPVPMRCLSSHPPVPSESGQSVSGVR